MKKPRGSIESIFPSSTSHIIDFMIKFQDLELSITEISKKTGIGYKTTLQIVHKLEKIGVVINIKNKGRSLFFKINQSSRIAKTLEKLAFEIVMKKEYKSK